MRETTRLILLAATAYLLAIVAGYFLSIGHFQRHHVESASFIGAVAWGLCWASLARRSSVDPQTPTPGSRRFELLWIGASFELLWIGASFVLYWRAISVGLLSDDYVLAEWARRWDLFPAGYSFVRPLPLVVWHFALKTPFAAVLLHGLNIGLHGLNSALVYRITRSLGVSATAALLCALMFLVWPTQVEAVVWTAGMFDVLSTTLMLFAVTMLLSRHGRTGSRTLIAVVLGVSSLLTKESAVSFFLLLGVLALFTADRSTRRDMMVVALALAMCTAAYMLCRVILHLPVTGIVTVSRYAVKEHLSRTFASLAVPLRSETVRALPVTGVLLSTAAIVFPTTSLVAPRLFQTGHRVALLGLLWVLIAAAPTVGYLYIGDSLDGSRYLYFAAAGWALFIGSSYDALTAHRLLARILVGAAAMCLAVLVVQQQQLIGSWRNAARERDRILEEADRSIREDRCGRTVFGGIPKVLAGAQLFNNGFEQALASRSEPPRGNRPCAMKWTDGRFTPQ